jgi:hypothetical protein
MDQADNDLTSEPWAALKEAWQGCAYCGATGGPIRGIWKSARPSPASVRKVSSIDGVSRCRRARSRQTD